MGTKCPKCEYENPDDTLFCGKCGTQFPSPEKVDITETLETQKEELTRGATLANRYEIIEELGKGGMGRVYRVEDIKLKQEVALKLIKPEIAKDKKTIERFRNELKLAREIAHRNVCHMYDLNEEKGTHYITMEYVRGEDLRSSIRRFGQLPIGKSISIAKQICEGLAEAHRLGVIHRDLKSNNIMIDKEGNVRIMDFGIARSLEGKGITAAGVIIGTPEYMSPEQVEGKEADFRSDIYSLGVILYEMVTGRVPFEGETPLSVAVKHKSEAPPEPKKLNTQIPENLNSVILKCLEKDKNNRYQTAKELFAEFTNIEKGILTTEREVPKRMPLTTREITVQFNLKKLIIPTVIFAAIVIIGVLIWKLLPKEERVPISSIEPSIAVLPFEDLSPQKDQEYLCNGLAESLINALTKVQDLRVPATTSSLSFIGKERDIHELGEKLNVKTVLRGSLQKARNRVRITAQLINVADESLFWSEQYNRDLDDVFTIQDEISIAIVDKLKVNLLGKEKAKLLKHHTDNPEAYNLYLKGRWFWNRRTEAGQKKSIEYFEQAIEKDPNYALAYAGISDAYNLLPAYAFLNPREAFPKAKEAALKALEIDETLAEAHTSLAWIKMNYEKDWGAAEREFKRSIELNPSYATTYHWYALFLMRKARFDEAIKTIKKAHELDPLSLVINRSTGRIFFIAGQYDLAVKALEKTIEMDPNFSHAHLFLGRVYTEKSMYEEALEEFQKEKSISIRWNPMVECNIGVTYVRMGKRDEAQQLLDDMIEQSKKKYVPPQLIAILYFALGEKDQGFKWLEKAYENHAYGLHLLKADPHFATVRSDPRYVILLEKIGFKK